MPLTVGTRLGNYEILGPLGEGGDESHNLVRFVSVATVDEKRASAGGK